ncbi:hypothetical protein PTKIN_Ptkin09bG0264300 [Pterospermum kingtungense]
MFTVPPGYRFIPTKQEIIWGYLKPAINGAPFFRDALIEADIYGGEPWNLFDENGKESFWVLTKLKKKSKSRIERTVGCGCWLGRCTKEINSESGLLLGFDKYFTFACKKHKPSCQSHGQWTMHEYSLKDQSMDDYVICEIKFKKDEVESKNKKRKSPPVEFYDDEEVLVPSTKKVSAGDYQESHVDANMEQISTMTSLIASTYQDNISRKVDHHQEAQSQNKVRTMAASTKSPDDFGDCIVPEDVFFDIDDIMNGLDLEEVISFKEVPVDDATLRICEGD